LTSNLFFTTGGVQLAKHLSTVWIYVDITAQLQGSCTDEGLVHALFCKLLVSRVTDGLG